MKVLVVGADGQLGQCLIDRAPNFDFEFKALTFEQLDITNVEQVENAVSEFKPNIIVNAAAYTAVDKAEEDVETAYLVNETGPKILAEVAANYDAALIHVSTDYVFDGTETTPYTPDFPVNPQSIYGKSKWAGEEAVRKVLDKHIIIRTAWVFSEYGNNFVKTILRLAKDRDELRIIADQYGCPTYAGDLAQAILQICDKVKGGNEIWGTYHYCGDQATSWHGFTMAIIDEAFKQKIIYKKPNVIAIPETDYPLPAPRPSYSVLDCSSILQHTVEFSGWRKSLNSVVKAIN